MTLEKKKQDDMRKAIEEKRQSPRYSFKMHLHLVFDDLDEFRNAYSKNVSEGGVFIKTEQPLPAGSRLQLKISLVHQDLTYVEADGVVAHVVKKGANRVQGMGVKFVRISEDGKHFIKEHILDDIEKERSDGEIKAKKTTARKSAAKKKGKKAQK